MKNLNKLVISGLVLVTVMILIGVLLNRESIVSSKFVATYNTPVKIGVLLPLSGTSAIIGQNVKSGVEKALAEVNIVKTRFVVVYEDNKLIQKKQ